MDPFQPDEDDYQHQSSGSAPPQASGSTTPRPPAQFAASVSASIADPFAQDDVAASGMQPEARPSETLSSSLPCRSAAQVESRRPPPAAVNSTSASLLLSSNPAGPSSPRRTPSQGAADHVALKMGDVSASTSGSAASYRDISDEDEPERDDYDVDEEEGGEVSGLLGGRGQGGPSRREERHKRSSSSASGATASTSSTRRRRRPRQTGALATLQALGRRIVAAARLAQQQDASSRSGGTIHLNSSTAPSTHSPATSHLSHREQALWLWANIEDFDSFLTELYAYYTGKGATCIALSRLAGLGTAAFVLGFSTFLFGCLDYTKIRHDGRLGDIVTPQCKRGLSPAGLSLGTLLVAVALLGLYGMQVVRVGLGLKRLRTMRYFYEYLLEVPERDVQTIPWHDVVERLSRLLESHPLPCLAPPLPGERGGHAGDGRPEAQSIDVHEVANRLMRQDNYLVALLDQDLLPLGLPNPFGILSSSGGGAQQQPLLTRSLQWNLEFCILGYLFDARGRVRRAFLSDSHRLDLIDGLKRRFVFMACLNAVFAPFIVLYTLVYSFFRYFEEYHKNPGTLGARQYTELARWKFREYNELPHLFRRRCHSSYPFADRYLAQFPRESQAILARFVSFIAGSIAGVLLLASLADPDLFLHFELTPGRNTLFYIGVFGAVLAVARGMVPDERLVFEPEVLLEAVVHHTHYCPPEWSERGFHSAEVNVEFAKLYDLKLAIFVREVLSVLVTPFVLAWALPRSAEDVVDFFREHTVHVDRLGYVCSYAVFDFGASQGDDAAAENEDLNGRQQRPPANIPPITTRNGARGLAISTLESDNEEEADSPPRGKPRSSSHRHRRDLDSGAADKMAQSALHFAATNAWQPDHPAASIYLEKLQRHHDQQHDWRQGTGMDRPSSQASRMLLSPRAAAMETEDLLLFSQLQASGAVRTRRVGKSKTGREAPQSSASASAGASLATSAATNRGNKRRVTTSSRDASHLRDLDEASAEDQDHEPFETISATTTGSAAGPPRSLLEHVGRRILP